MNNILEDALFRIEGADAVAEYFSGSASKGVEINLYNWECPPRQLRDDHGETKVNFDIDLDLIFNNRKIDFYTEIPRIVSIPEKEVSILKYLEDSYQIKIRFTKLIADTNLYFLYQDFMDPEDISRAEVKIREFRDRINDLLIGQYPADSTAILFTDLIKDVRSRYETYYNEAITILSTNPAKIISSQVLEQQLRRMHEHVGFSENKSNELSQFAKKVAASYGAEGMIFDLLNKSRLPNSIWLNFEEQEERVMATTNMLRQLHNLQNLPMLLPKT